MVLISSTDEEGSCTNTQEEDFKLLQYFNLNYIIIASQGRYLEVQSLFPGSNKTFPLEILDTYIVQKATI